MGCGNSTLAQEPTSVGHDNNKDAYENNHYDSENNEVSNQHIEQYDQDYGQTATEQDIGHTDTTQPEPTVEQRAPEESEKTLVNIDEEKPKEILNEEWVKQRKKQTLDESAFEQAEDGIVGARKDGDLKVMMGRMASLLDTRWNRGKEEGNSRPVINGGDLYTDPDFPFEVAMNGEEDADNIQWMRPKEFSENPALFTEGTTRFDITQGGAGTCWFLSILSALGDKPEVLKQIIPDDAYKLGTDAYDGVFHCRFWKFGQWVDVYCDDFLPVRRWGEGYIPWGSRSSDPNEMWVSLMEKAFARWNGGYPRVYGGWPGDAFIALTGGVAERVEAQNTPPTQLYSRIRNALSSGAVIACSCPSHRDGDMGLVGGHAYTVTGATKINHQGSVKAMIRVRNPWGVGKGEWQGAWCDSSPHWDEVPAEIKEKLKVQGREDGEFWMTLQDYMEYFSDSHICNFTPDFDQDGKEDGLNQVNCVLGEWRGETAAGCGPDTKMDNQKYIFNVPKKGLDEGGKLPIVLQIIQYKEYIKSKQENFFIRLDLYKIDGQCKKGDKTHLVLDEITNYLTYYGGSDYAYRYRLAPGDYMMLPTTMEPGQERAFCLRLFSSVPIKCRELSSKAGMYVRKVEPTFDYHGEEVTLKCLAVQFGAWVAGKNAGGQICHQTFHINPQFFFSLQDYEPVMIDLLQENTHPKIPIGFKVFQVPTGTHLPLDLRTIYQNYKNAVEGISGKTPFVVGYEAEAYFLMPPGDHVLVVFSNDPDVPKDFVIVTATNRGSTVQFKPCN